MNKSLLNINLNGSVLIKSKISGFKRGIEKDNSHSVSKQETIYQSYKIPPHNCNFLTPLIRFEAVSAIAKMANENAVGLPINNSQEFLNKRMNEISWTISHVLRAPLANIMGLVTILEIVKANDDDFQNTLQYLIKSANDLDVIIRELSSRADVT